MSYLSIVNLEVRRFFHFVTTTSANSTLLNSITPSENSIISENLVKFLQQVAVPSWVDNTHALQTTALLVAHFNVEYCFTVLLNTCMRGRIRGK